MTKIRLALAALLTAGACSAADVAFLKKGDLWLLTGDSITSTDIYRQLLQLAVDHYHPGSGIVLANRAVWGQLSKEAEKTSGTKLKPTVVSIMIGMNDVIHRDFAEQPDVGEIAAKYRETIVRQVRGWKEKGAEVILMTPTLTDEREGNFFCLYNSTPGLLRLDEEVRKIAAEEKCRLIDMSVEFEVEQRKLGKKICYRPDGVHPFGWGQYVIAQTILRHLALTRPLATDERGWSEALAGEENAFAFAPADKFQDGDRPAFLVSAARKCRATLRWTIGASHGAAALELGPDAVRWTLPGGLPAMAMKAGEFRRLAVSLEAEGGRPVLFVTDLARTLVYQMKDGKASGEVRTSLPRAEGPLVATWQVEENGPELWLTGRVYGRNWPVQKRGLWSNAFQQNGLQLLFDFRPGERFADLSPDRDTHTMLMSVYREPHFAVGPLAWLNRGIQPCTVAHASPTEDGWTFVLGFRGYKNDYTEFDITQLDCFGMHFNVALADEKGAIRRYDTMKFIGDNPFNESRLNQSMVFVRKGGPTGPETTTVKTWKMR